MKKFFSIFLSLVFLFSLFLSSLACSLQNTLFQASFHLKNLQKIDLYQKAATDIVPNLLAQQEESPLSQMPLTKEDLGQIIQASLPQGWLETEVEKNLNNSFAYLKGKRTNLALSINLTPVKETLDQSLARNLQNQLQQLPTCTQQQMLAMQSGRVDKLECLPPQMQAGDISGEFDRELAKMTENIPDKMNPTENLPAEAEEQLQKIRQGYQVFRAIQLGLIILTIILFLSLLLLNKKNILGYLKGLSIALVILSTLSLAGRFLIKSNIAKLAANIPAADNSALDALKNDLISVTLNGFLSYTSKITIVILAVSVAYLAGFSAKKTFQQ